MDRFCRNCGAPLTDRASFCARCGTPVNTASAGMEPGHQNNSGFASAPAPTSGSSAGNVGNPVSALIDGAILVGLAFLPYVKLGSMSIALKDSSEVWIYFACVAVLVVSELTDKPILSVVGGAASILYNLYEIGDAQDTLGIFSDALDLSWGFWLIMIFSGLAVLSGIIDLWKTKNGR